MSKKGADDAGELSSIPNDKYKKFFAKFAEIATLDVKEWKAAHLLGYFCQKYKEAYGVDYSWKFNNPSPTKCFEVWQLNVLVSKLSQNPQILKDYIDWGFANLVPKAQRRLTSISFLTKEEVIIPYKMKVLLGGKKDLHVDRSTFLPENYFNIIKDTTGLSNIKTYGDLAFILQMDMTAAEPPISMILIAVDKMEQSGFDREVLKRIV